MPFGGGFRRGGFRRNNDFGPRTMHKITCSECGKEDEVPFKPREGSSVLCKECFMKKKGIKPRDQEESGEKKEKKSEDAEENVEVSEEDSEESEDEEY